MDRWVGRVVLVTGAASGMGAAVSQLLTEHGMKVIGCDINEIKHKPVGKGVFQAMTCDLSKEDDILAMFEEIKQSHSGVDVCVNCAGFALPGSLLTGKTSNWVSMFNVNVLGLCICTREAVRQMRERNVDDGHIFNISSVAAHRVNPGAPDESFYGGTKRMVSGLTEALRQELRVLNSHIRVTVISPGNTQSNFFSTLYNDELAEQAFSEIKCLQPSDIAAVVLDVLKSPPNVQINEITVRPVEQVS